MEEGKKVQRVGVRVADARKQIEGATGETKRALDAFAANARKELFDRVVSQELRDMANASDVPAMVSYLRMQLALPRA